MTFTKKKSAPKEAANEKVKKLHVVSVRLTDEQLKAVEENRRKSGRKMSDYMRLALLGAKITPIASPEDMSILRKIAGMTGLLNQLTKKAHEAGLKVVKWKIEAMLKEIRQLYYSLAYDWRPH